jgi:hypothetical protein
MQNRSLVHSPGLAFCSSQDWIPLCFTGVSRIVNLTRINPKYQKVPGDSLAKKEVCAKKDT